MLKVFTITLLFSFNLFAQSFKISGLVQDENSSENLSSVSIYVNEANRGTTTNEQGKFSLANMPKGNYQITFSYLGYEKKIVNVNLNKNVFLEINLAKINILLEESVITGTYPKFRETAVAFTDINSDEIELCLGAKEAVNILEGTPSLFVSEQGGGIGEQRLNLRGFDQTNVAVMVNGIPINNPENGEVYWSNWTGFSNILKRVNVQRGFSAIPYSTSAIGGAVNFITIGAERINPTFKYSSEIGSFNHIKNSVAFSLGLMQNVNFTASVTKRTSNGFAEQNYSNEYNFFIALGMYFRNHTLQVQFYGSPQEHGQRLTPHKISTWQKYGLRYNSDWGYLNGKPINLRDNKFYSPTLNINYNWSIKKKLQWNNIVSLSRGKGGGTVPPFYPQLSQTEEGLVDFDKEWKINSNNIDPTYSSKLNKSIIALRKGVHENYWGNLISVLKFDVKKFKVSLGLDTKIYQADNYHKIKNLLGGDYLIGRGDVNQPMNKMLFAGDKVDFFARSFTRSYGGFFQTEFVNDKVSAYANISVSNTDYNRIDYFNYSANDPKRETGWKSFLGYTLKTGVNYNLNKNSNVFLNLGKFSKAPLAMNVYDYFNNLYENVKNEDIYSFEAGYGLKTNLTKLKVNYFYTYWEHKSFTQTLLNQDSSASYYYNLFGASARHTGLEVEGDFYLRNNLKLNTMFSYSINKWTKDIGVYIRPESNPTDEIKYNAYIKDLFVGNFPMTSANIGLYYEHKFGKNNKVYVNPNFYYYGRYYANFNPVLRNSKSERKKQSWKLPDFSNLNLHFGIEFNFKKFFIENLKISFHTFNLLNSENIISAIDGVNHQKETASVWYNKSRWWNLGLNLEGRIRFSRNLRIS